MTKKEVLGMNDRDIDRVVKIQGTRFDRKRKVSKETIEKIKYLRVCGKSYSSIAKELGISDKTARYYCDDFYRWLDCHKGGTHKKSAIFTPSERGGYKRRLVSANAHVIYPKD